MNLHIETGQDRSDIEIDPKITIPIIEPEKFPEHASFLGTVISTAKILEQAGVSLDQVMVISGGSVALRQMASGINDRVPTDLDLIINYQNKTEAEEILEIMTQRLKSSDEFIGTKLIREPRHHWEYVFTNPILETSYTNNGSMVFPVDFMTKMTTVFPSGCKCYIPKLSGVAYDFPIKDILFKHSQPFQIGSQVVKATHPAFALFYKLTMNRNGYNSQHPESPKQDDQDLKRMVEMGLVNPQDSVFQEVLATLAYYDPELIDQIQQSILHKINSFGQNA